MSRSAWIFPILMIAFAAVGLFWPIDHADHAYTAEITAWTAPPPANEIRLDQGRFNTILQKIQWRTSANDSEPQHQGAALDAWQVRAILGGESRLAVLQQEGQTQTISVREGETLAGGSRVSVITSSRVTLSSQDGCTRTIELPTRPNASETTTCPKPR